MLVRHVLVATRQTLGPRRPAAIGETLSVILSAGGSAAECVPDRDAGAGAESELEQDVRHMSRAHPSASSSRCRS
jgi:hypothetical protein